MPGTVGPETSGRPETMGIAGVHSQPVTHVTPVLPRLRQENLKGQFKQEIWLVN